jgi:hypothetical protein
MCVLGLRGDGRRYARYARRFAPMLTDRLTRGAWFESASGQRLGTARTRVFDRRLWDQMRRHLRTRC